MKVYCKYRKPRVNYWGSSYLSERFGIQSILNKGNKMPLKKNDVILFYIPHDYAEATGLLESKLYLSGNSDKNGAELMIAKFIEYDDFGGVWLKSIFADDKDPQGLMIPHDVIMIIVLFPTRETEEHFGFKIPEEYKKLLDK